MQGGGGRKKPIPEAWANDMHKKVVLGLLLFSYTFRLQDTLGVDVQKLLALRLFLNLSCPGMTHPNAFWVFLEPNLRAVWVLCVGLR